MDYDWSSEQLELRRKATAFARRVSLADIVDADRRSAFNREQWDAYGVFGLFATIVPAEYGGRGEDLLTCAAILEGLGYGSNDGGVLLAALAHMFSCIDPLLEFGTDEQKTRLLPDLAQGRLIGLHAITEPEAGSDSLRNMKTFAEKRGDHYLLNGSKTYITNAGVADVMLVLVRTQREAVRGALSCFIVEQGTPGCTVCPIEKMGTRSAPFGTIDLVECEVPASNLVGEEGQGDGIFDYMMGRERVMVLPSQIGQMESQLEQATVHAGTRQQFGQPISEFGAVAGILAEMKVRLESARLLADKAVWLAALGRNDVQFTSIAKLYVTEAAVQNSLSAMRVYGGQGYTAELGVERQLRDAIGGLFIAGTSEIMKKIIAGIL